MTSRSSFAMTDQKATSLSLAALDGIFGGSSHWDQPGRYDMLPGEP
jgi:hypothetical protein